MNTTQPRKLSLSVQYAVEPTKVATLPTRPQFRRWAQAALRRDAEITLRLVDEAEGQRLNRDYRGKDYATNVLTFTYEESPLSGDIVLCAPVIAREAAAQQKKLLAHYAHLVVHGVLHLQGYDHEKIKDARQMEQLEAEILTKMGYDDPYRA